MKKILLSMFLILLIPYIVVTLCIQDDEIHFQFGSTQMVRVKREATGEIEKIPFEEYITGVLAGEMPVNFELEALKAQAVAARSYVLKKIEQNQNEEFDVVDTVMNQVYVDETTLKSRWNNEYTEKMNKLKTAIVETKGEYMTYEGNVIEAFFFSTSSGKTENVEEVFVSALPYLRSVDSSWDAEVSPVFQETNTFSLHDFYLKLGLPYQETLQINITKTTSTGRIKELIINDTAWKASDVASKLNLRSTYFIIEQLGNNVKIETKGYGHGVGMSQYGAQAMAQKGYTYDQILKYYYQGVQISKI